jgi:hypothetical protein
VNEVKKSIQDLDEKFNCLDEKFGKVRDSEKTNRDLGKKKFKSQIQNLM